ncbi:MAG: type III secretion system inner membrane ring subunit SctD [Deltaproteobacteria bacterium]|jgi:type III secretion protein D|nr:type III secretion system inner membrane ring subunit SctD [Deltaproteobacteria bacterium]
MMQEGGILLGIFTGNHAGAETPLPPGEYVIGSAEECDLVLTDSTLSPRHCLLTVSPEGAVRLAPAEGALLFEGAPLEGALDWPALAPALAGMVCLAWTRTGQGWTGLKLPPLLGEEGLAGPADAPSQSQEARDDPETAPRAVQVEDGLARLPGGERLSSPWLTPRRLLPLGAALLLLLGLSIGLPSYYDQGGPGARARVLETVLREKGFAGLRVEESSGLVSIYGLTPTADGANKVRNIAAGQSYQVRVVVRGREEFVRAVREALEGRGLFLEVALDEEGALLRGYVQDALVEGAALAWAREAAPPVVAVRSGLLTRSVVEPPLLEALRKANLKGRAAVDWRPGVIALVGVEADKTALGAMARELGVRLGAPVAFRVESAGTLTAEAQPARPAEAQPARPAENFLAPVVTQSGPFGGGLTLRGVTPARKAGGVLEPAFITTSDGAVYFVGGALPGGYVLKGIYPDRLEFLKNGSIVAHKLQGH